MTNIYGSIGFSFLFDNDRNRYILILADMHSKLSYCDNSPIKINEWFLNKIKSSSILLEEVPRSNVELKELWSESPHTQDLKNLFLKNSDIIHALDIRPSLIPFSWELIKLDVPNIKLNEYLETINKFFNFEIEQIKKILNHIYSKSYLTGSKLGKHYDIVKNNYDKYLLKYNKFLNDQIFNIYNSNIDILENINIILDEIMEWFILAKIESLNNNIIIHTGLAHSEKTLKWLIELYNCKLIYFSGVNKFSEINNITHGCVNIPLKIDKIL